VGYPIREDDLVAFFAYLYGNWTLYGGDEARNDLWVKQKRPWMEAVTYSRDDVNITVDRGM
jgi:hypothetical protein